MFASPRHVVAACGGRLKRVVIAVPRADGSFGVVALDEGGRLGEGNASRGDEKKNRCLHFENLEKTGEYWSLNLSVDRWFCSKQQLRVQSGIYT